MSFLRSVRLYFGKIRRQAKHLKATNLYLILSVYILLGINFKAASQLFDIIISPRFVIFAQLFFFISEVPIKYLSLFSRKICAIRIYGRVIYFPIAYFSSFFIYNFALILLYISLFPMVCVLSFKKDIFMWIVIGLKARDR